MWEEEKAVALSTSIGLLKGGNDRSSSMNSSDWLELKSP
jgi:hypothetical protein